MKMLHIFKVKRFCAHVLPRRNMKRGNTKKKRQKTGKKNAERAACQIIKEDKDMQDRRIMQNYSLTATSLVIWTDTYTLHTILTVQ